MNHDKILILDFGSQYNQLIARRIRENSVYCELKPFFTSVEEIKKFNPKGIIFSGGPNSVYAQNSPDVPDEIFKLGIPVLGICYGMQLITKKLGGKVERSSEQEFGFAAVGAQVDIGNPNRPVMDRLTFKLQRFVLLHVCEYWVPELTPR